MQPLKDPIYEASTPESGKLTRLFNPRTDAWNEHFVWKAASLSLAHINTKGTKWNIKTQKPLKILCLFRLLPFVFFPFRYAGEGFSCGEIPGVGRTTPFDGTGVGFSFSGSTFGERRSSSGCPAISNLTSAASRDSRSSSASAIRISASRFSERILFARS